MIATKIEITIIKSLQRCTYLPASFDKKFPREIDATNISPLQKYWIYKLGYKYRKQIGSTMLEMVCKEYLETNPDPPQSRKESNKILKSLVK